MKHQSEIDEALDEASKVASKAANTAMDKGMLNSLILQLSTEVIWSTQNSKQLTLFQNCWCNIIEKACTILPIFCAHNIQLDFCLPILLVMNGKPLSNWYVALGTQPVASKLAALLYCMTVKATVNKYFCLLLQPRMKLSTNT